MPLARPVRTVLGMSRSATVAVVFKTVMPALGLALVLGASLLPAVAIAVVVGAAILGGGARGFAVDPAAVPSDTEVSRSGAQTYYEDFALAVGRRDWLRPNLRHVQLKGMVSTSSWPGAPSCGSLTSGAARVC